MIIDFAKSIMRGRVRKPCRKLFVEFFAILLDKTYGGVIYYGQQSSASLPTVLTTPSQDVIDRCYLPPWLNMRICQGKKV